MDREERRAGISIQEVTPDGRLPSEKQGMEKKCLSGGSLARVSSGRQMFLQSTRARIWLQMCHSTCVVGFFSLYSGFLDDYSHFF